MFLISFSRIKPTNPLHPSSPTSLPTTAMEFSSLDNSAATDSTSVSPTTVLAAPAPPPDGVADAESRKLPSSRYKGVVPQPNGRWGAQIYEKHQRVWLGTFNEEDEAAAVYDVAARRFRGRDAVTNFAAVGDGVEAEFLTSHSKAEIVDMLRKHTYGDELEQCRRREGCSGGRRNVSVADPMAAAEREELFEKMVTPSDVGKLNRLVIPKQHAERHFPLAVGGGGSGTTGVLLNFEDEGGRVWRFRYSYWNSSQSYVLTKGWSRFVKEKGMVSGDVVRFYRSGGDEGQLYIECMAGRREDDKVTEVVQVLRLFGVDIFSFKMKEDCGFREGGKRGRDDEEECGLNCRKKVDYGVL